MTRLSLVLMLVACLSMSCRCCFSHKTVAEPSEVRLLIQPQHKAQLKALKSRLSPKVARNSQHQRMLTVITSAPVFPAGRYLISIYREGYGDRLGKPVTVVNGGDHFVPLKMTKKDNIVTFFQKFGFVFWPLALCSITALTFIIERLFTFVRSRSRIGTEQFIASIADSLRKENIMEAVSTCEEAGGPLANVLKAGLLRYSQAQIEERDITKEEIQEAIEEASLLEIPELERNLPVLGTVAVVSPLFGLLGTVYRYD